MNTSTFALIAGIVYLVIGFLGLIPAMLVPPPENAPPTTFAFIYGYLFGLFPVNVLHSLVHLAIGIWGIAAGAGRGNAVTYARSVAVLFGVLAVLGMLPMTNTLFGLMPLDSHNVWLHGLTAIAAAYFGWRRPVSVSERRLLMHDRRQRTLPVDRERRFGLADRRDTWGGMAPA